MIWKMPPEHTIVLQRTIANMYVCFFFLLLLLFYFVGERNQKTLASQILGWRYSGGSN